MAVTLNDLSLPVKWWNWLLPASVYRSNFIITQNSYTHAKMKYNGIVAYAFLNIREKIHGLLPVY